MIQKITDIQEGVTFYVNEYGICSDIDIDPTLDTLMFQTFANSNVFGKMVHRGTPTYTLRDVKKQFPNIRKILIERGVSNIDISNMMFPNVKFVSSANPHFVDGKNILINRTYGGTLQLNNTFCKKEDEVIDLKCISLITNFAFEGCMSKNIVHSDTIHSIHSHALDGYMLFGEDEWTDGIKSLGSVLIGVDSNADIIELPEKIEAVYNPDVIKPMKKVIIHSKKQLPLMKSKISAETVAFGKEFNLDSLQFFESSVYGIQAENIEIPEDNQFFCSVDGVVFSKDKKTLVSYPKDKKGKYEIPEGTKTIWRNAFKESNIPAVRIADSVTHIQSYAFHSCSNIESIEFGAGISDFGFFGSGGIFAACNSLKEIEIPSAVENLAAYMFDGSPIETIIFHKGLKQIKSYDFTDCPITDITFPTSLESIGSYNFYSLETARVTNRIPDGLIRCMTRRWNPNDRDVSQHPAIKDLLYTIIITENGEEKTLYIPRYLALGASSELDVFLSNFSWNLKPESYYNMLFEKCTEEFLQQETAIAMYMINGDEEIKKYLKKASRKIVNRLLREENEEKFATFLQFGLLTERVLDSLFKTAQENNMTTVQTYILNEKEKINAKKAKKTSRTGCQSFRI